MSDQSCGTCKWYRKARKEYEFGQCNCPLPFWCYKNSVIIQRPDLNENEGKDCAAWEEKPNE